MMNIIRQLIKPKYETLNRIEIDEGNIIDNFNYLKSLQPNAEVFPVLKANAYGHGLKEICTILNKTSAKMVVVDSFPEAQIAYRYFKGKILILGEMPLRVYNFTKLKRTEFVVYNETTLKYLSRFGKKAQIHLFVNSGMNREGIKNLKSFMTNNKKYLDKVEIVGICSHLASADSLSIMNQSQEDKFMEDLDTLRSAGYFPKWIHLGNSAAIFKSENNFLTAFRPGLALYGYNPFQSEGDGDDSAVMLKPALEVFSRLVSLQAVGENESVSYNETYRSPSNSLIGVIPFGYFEGLDRRLSNRAQFLVYGENSFYAPIAGRVCMNLTCLEIGNRNVQIGGEVKLVSKYPNDPNSVANLSVLMNTIPYEFLVKFQSNIRKNIVNISNS